MKPPPDPKESPCRGGSRQGPESTTGGCAGVSVNFVAADATVVNAVGVRHAPWAVGDAGMPAERAPGAPSALPCLNSHNCTKVELSSNARKTAYSLTANVLMMAERHGIERLLFNTLTFRDHVTDGREAQRRLHSLATHVLRQRYLEYIVVVERQKSGRIHYHLLCAVDHDVRTGFDFQQAAEGVYSSASGALRSEWAFWRRTAPKYGFGRTEQMPVRSTSEGIAKYVGKYIAKHVDKRRQDDKGLRLVRYSEGSKNTTNQFAWYSPAARLWRAKLRTFAKEYSIHEYDELSRVLGSRWAYKFRDAIASTIVPDEELSWDLMVLQYSHLGEAAQVISAAIGADSHEILCALRQRAV